MIRDGWLDEVNGLLEMGLDPDIPAFQAIGYRQLAAHIRGDLTLDRATEEIVRATRRLAKRQMTWFRRVADVCWLSMEDSPGALREAMQFWETTSLGGKNG